MVKPETASPVGGPSRGGPDHIKSVDIFISYSHKDCKLRDGLETHLSGLKKEKIVRSWHDRKITAGKEWLGEINKHLESARLILLLISADFLASDYCYDNEMKRALKRHEERTARTIPVLLRPADWRHSPFAKLQTLPRSSIPVTSWRNRDAAFLDVVCGIRDAIEEITRESRPMDEPSRCDGVLSTAVPDGHEDTIINHGQRPWYWEGPPRGPST